MNKFQTTLLKKSLAKQLYKYKLNNSSKSRNFKIPGFLVSKEYSKLLNPVSLLKLGLIIIGIVVDIIFIRLIIETNQDIHKLIEKIGEYNHEFK